jgi:hypothetical protein
MAQAILHGPPPSLRDASKFSVGFVEIVTECLHKDPTKRASASQISQVRLRLRFLCLFVCFSFLRR